MDSYSYSTMGELKVGDKVIGSDGSVTEVTEAFDVHLPERMYEIVTEDGNVIKASGNHLWYCESPKDRLAARTYYREMKRYFKRNEPLSKLEEDVELPLELIGTYFAGDLKKNDRDRKAIERVALSMGPSYDNTHRIYDEFTLNVLEERVWSYSVNNLIDFLAQMKKAVVDKDGYFYFGQVRTTDEISLLPGVNIPTIKETKRNNTNFQ